MRLRQTMAAGLIALMPFTLAACADEDGDGAVTDEEVPGVTDTVGETGDAVTDTSADVTETTEAN